MNLFRLYLSSTLRLSLVNLFLYLHLVQVRLVFLRFFLLLFLINGRVCPLLSHLVSSFTVLFGIRALESPNFNMLFEMREDFNELLWSDGFTFNTLHLNDFVNMRSCDFTTLALCVTVKLDFICFWNVFTRGYSISENITYLRRINFFAILLKPCVFGSYFPRAS